MNEIDDGFYRALDKMFLAYLGILNLQVDVKDNLINTKEIFA